MSGLEPDTRVLQPTGREVWVSSSWSGTGDAYHSHRCQAVKTATNPRKVDLAVAEWKGYHLCQRCIDFHGATEANVRGVADE